MKGLLVILQCAMAAVVFAAKDCNIAAGGRGMDRTRLNIGVYCLMDKARTEAHVRDLRDCGIDFVTAIEGGADMKPTFDLFQKYGIGAIVPLMSPYWNEAQHLAGTDIDKLYAFDRVVRNAERHVFRHHPAVWGYDLGDEPGAGSFPFFGRLAQAVHEKCPEKQIYLNLYPNCVPKRDERQVEGRPNIYWDTYTYEEYIESFCAQVPVDYISYDFYLYRDLKRRIPLSYENMRVVSTACREHGRDFWTVLQVNSCDPGRPISLNGLRFQAYQAMAYGATTLMWACYSPGWWHHNVLTKEGEKTGQYEKLKTVNAEIRSFAQDYMRFRNRRTVLVGDFDAPTAMFRPGDGTLQKGERAGTSPVVERFANEAVIGLRAADGAALIVGDMALRANGAERALFICAADDPTEMNPARHEIVLSPASGYEVRALGVGGRIPAGRNANGEIHLPISSNEGMLIILKDL